MIQRIWKYRLHYILVLPAILLLLLFKIFPLFLGAIMSFKHYILYKGISASPWVGLGNFKTLFGNPQFRNALENTFIFKLEYVLICGGMAFVLAMAINALKWKRGRRLLSALLLIPYFIPSVVFAYLAITWLHLDFFVLVDSWIFRSFYILLEAGKTCGIPIVLALAAIEASQANNEGTKRSETVAALRAIAAFGVLQLSTLLTMDFELLHTLINPIVLNVAETIDTYAFRIGLLSGNYSEVAAIQLFQFTVQLAGTLTAYWLIKGIFFKDLFTNAPIPKVRRTGTSIVIKTAIIVVTLLSFVIFIDILYSGNVDLERFMPWGRYKFHIVSILVVVVVNLLITLTLSYPLTVKDLPGRGLYKFFLLIIAATGTSSFISEFMLFKIAGMTNTIFPEMILGMTSIVNVFVLKSIFNSRFADLKEHVSSEGRGELYCLFFIYIPKIWRTLIALGVLQFVAIWNSYLNSLLYTNNPKIYSPVMAFRGLLFTTDKMGVTFGVHPIWEAAIILTLPSVLLFLMFRKWITSEVLLSQIRRL